MSETGLDSENLSLSERLREARPSPALPPRFQENVWKRIESAEAGGASAASVGWLESLAAMVLRPRFALAAVTALVLAGAFLGVQEGAQAARQEALARYVAAVAPNVLR